GLGDAIPLSLRLLGLPGMALVARGLYSPASARAAVDSCFYDRSRVPPALYEEATRYRRSVAEAAHVLRAGLTLRGIRAAVRAPWLARATGFTRPVLVVWGREDAVLPPPGLAAIGAAVPQAEVRLVDRCGHLVMIERSDEFLAALLPFLDRAERADSDSVLSEAAR
ncbi:MAG: alpha/beta fold hydrolase, partial [Candidatus Limnocylindria bacterium]